jgi:hypothetical protein
MFDRLFPTVRSLDRGSLILALRRAGRMSQPDGDGGGAGGTGGGGEGKGGEGGKGGTGGKEGEGGEGGEGGNGDGKGGKTGGEGGDHADVPYSRFAEVVTERNAATRESKDLKKEVDRLTAQVTQLSANDQSGTVADLQKQIKELQKQIDTTDDYFSTLLEADLANLGDDAKALVADVPGTARDKYQFLAKHRARLSGTGGEGGEGGEGTRGKPGPTHERKPGGGGEAGVSAKTKARIEAQNARVRKGQGWTAPVP